MSSYADFFSDETTNSNHPVPQHVLGLTLVDRKGSHVPPWLWFYLQHNYAHETVVKMGLHRANIRSDWNVRRGVPISLTITIYNLPGSNHGRQIYWPANVPTSSVRCWASKVAYLNVPQNPTTRFTFQSEHRLERDSGSVSNKQVKFIIVPDVRVDSGSGPGIRQSPPAGSW